MSMNLSLIGASINFLYSEYHIHVICVFFKLFFIPEIRGGAWIGKGEPVDEIDSLCYNLMNCYKCAKLDKGKDCDGGNNYDWYTKVNGKIKCGKFNLNYNLKTF